MIPAGINVMYPFGTTQRCQNRPIPGDLTGLITKKVLGVG